MTEVFDDVKSVLLGVSWGAQACMKTIESVSQGLANGVTPERLQVRAWKQLGTLPDVNSSDEEENFVSKKRKVMPWVGGQTEHDSDGEVNQDEVELTEEADTVGPEVDSVGLEVDSETVEVTVEDTPRLLPTSKSAPKPSRAPVARVGPGTKPRQPTMPPKSKPVTPVLGTSISSEYKPVYRGSVSSSFNFGWNHGTQ